MVEPEPEFLTVSMNLNNHIDFPTNVLVDTPLPDEAKAAHNAAAVKGIYMHRSPGSSTELTCLPDKN